jgi:hypothetical protein
VGKIAFRMDERVTGHPYCRQWGTQPTWDCLYGEASDAGVEGAIPNPALHPQSMLRTQRTSLQELSNHERFLIKLNEELIEAIRCMEDSTALTVRTMVQQHYVLGVSEPARCAASALPRVPARGPRALSWPLPTPACAASSIREPQLFTLPPTHWALEPYRGGGSPQSTY